MGRGLFGLGNIRELVNFKDVKEDAIVMAGGAAAGFGYSILASKLSWFNTPVKRAGLAFLVGVVGPKVVRKYAKGGLAGKAANGIQGAMGFAIGAEVAAALSRTAPASDGTGTGGYMDDDGLQLSDVQVEERRLTSGGAFGETDIDEQPAARNGLAALGW